jgi:signal transduction histidine kinase
MALSWAAPTTLEAGIQWLIRIRWVATVGVLAVVVAAGPILGLVVHEWILLALASSLGAFNAVLILRRRRGRSIPSPAAQVVVDLAVLGALLAFSGGLRNPFSVFLIAQVMVAAILLPTRATRVLAAVAVGIAFLLAAVESARLLPDSGPLRESLAGPAGVWGIALAVLITTVVACHFLQNLLEDARRRSLEAERFHEAAEQERMRLREVVRSIGAGMVVLDGSLRVSWWNRRAEETIPGLQAGSPFHLAGLGDWPSAEGLAGGESMSQEWSGLDLHGRTRVHHVIATPVASRDGSLQQAVVVLSDITERRAAEEHLYRTEKLAALGRLSAAVAHEINTPLASVRLLGSEIEGLLPLAFAGDERARAEVRTSLGSLRRENDRIANLTRRLLDTSHPGRDVAEATDVASLVEEAVRLVSLRRRRAGPPVAIRDEAGRPLLHLPRDRLRQVVLNVLDNALDATRAGGGVTVTLAPAEPGLAILIADEGHGIPGDVLPHVFEPFFTTKEVGEGTGLGLYVSYEIMKNLGGEIAIESRLGQGTIVRLVLPDRKSPPP